MNQKLKQLVKQIKKGYTKATIDYLATDSYLDYELEKEKTLKEIRIK